MGIRKNFIEVDPENMLKTEVAIVVLKVTLKIDTVENTYHKIKVAVMYPILVKEGEIKITKTIKVTTDPGTTDHHTTKAMTLSLNTVNITRVVIIDQIIRNLIEIKKIKKKQPIIKTEKNKTIAQV